MLPGVHHSRMQTHVLSLLACLLTLPLGFAAETKAGSGGEEPRVPGPEAQRQPGVPRGNVIGPLVWSGKTYPGISRHYWIYVPAQYRPLEPACLMVFQDGVHYLREDGEVRAAIVFDNLIHRKE